ncbi:hypothetical protein R1flu_025078 [Riccia fluitans]|uniref:PH domain-containing protein n=1 Tax=Riccia fluitans TaxID=41844 RepID=A0ABD1XWQ9_9MARC
MTSMNHSRISHSGGEDPYIIDRARDSFSHSGLRSHSMLDEALASFAQPPETPQEPMEFLSRSWSISAVDVQRAVAPVPSSVHEGRKVYGIADLEPEAQLETAPFSFASSMTSQLVMDRILTPGPQEHSPFASRRNSHSSGPLSFASPPVSPRGSDYYRRQSFSLVPRGKSMGRWIKDMKEKKKELNRTRKAQVHAAVTVAGVAAAIAAVAAATAASSTDEQSTRTAMAMASAAALVAAQCVEVAESLGADREQMASVVSSAVSVKSAGDILTLTASAATALRGAATLRQRTMKDARSVATVMPYERSVACQSSLGYGSDCIDEDSEIEYSTHEILSRGAEFLKRSRSGEVQWRHVFVYLNKQGQVVLKLQSKIMGGALKKNKKSLVLHVYPDIPAWPGRQLLDNGDQRRYFALKTSRGDVEFECRTVREHQVWTEGINRLLCLSRRYCQR